jgi:DNA damage-inducible protein 1
MLYVDVKVNGVKVKALVDSGAQATIMSPSCAEACNIMHLVDRRFAGVARGVGTANIIGRVHYTMLQVGSRHLPAAFTVMEGKQVDLLLGLDILKGHQATIDLAKNKLIIQGEEVDFLGEADVPKETEEAVNQEPTVQGPGGTTIGARSGAVTAPSGAAAGSAAPAMNPVQAPAPAGPVLTPRPAAPTGAGAPNVPPDTQGSRFPDAHIQNLVALGVTREQAIQALESTNGDVEFAASLIFSRM